MCIWLLSPNLVQTHCITYRNPGFTQPHLSSFGPGLLQQPMVGSLEWAAPRRPPSSPLTPCFPHLAPADSSTLGSGSTMTEVGWWKLTFLRKKKSTPKVLYEIPDTYAQTEGGSEPPRPEGRDPKNDFDSRLEKIVDKSTKGKHVKVSNSGRFKEKKKVRATLAENPNLFDDREGKGQ